MNIREAQKRASRLGLAAWIAQAVAVGPEQQLVDLKCVGFASIDLPLGEGETWEEALQQVTRTIFRA